MKKFLILLIAIVLPVQAKDVSRSIGYDKLRVGMEAREMMNILKTDYADWSVDYMDVMQEPEPDPNVESYGWDAYWKITGNSGLSILIFMTEGRGGQIAFLIVKRKFKYTYSLYSWYYSLRNYMTEKYGKESDTNHPHSGGGFDHDVHSSWKVSKNLGVWVYGSYCVSTDSWGKDRPCHNAGAGYRDYRLEKKRSEWKKKRQEDLKKMKFKHNISRY